MNSGTANSTYGILANTWLANLGVAPNTGNFNLTYLNDGNREYTQDMVVFTKVPEPLTFGLLAIGLLSLEYRRERFRKKLAILPSNKIHDSTHWIK